MPMPLPSWRDVLGFWREAGPKRWFAKDDAFDQAIRSRFLGLQQAAARGDLASWEETADGALALIILLDQFPRNLFRRSPQAFATDAQARGVARRALSRGFERRCDRELVQFPYMPLMHRRLWPIKTAALPFSRRWVGRRLSAPPGHIATSSRASGASRTAMPCWGA